MTASWSLEDDIPVHPLAVGARPESILEALDVPDRGRFQSAYERALDAAKKDLDLTDVLSVLEEFRRLAILQTDRPGWRRTVRAAARAATGQESPDDEPLEITRTKAGM